MKTFKIFLMLMFLGIFYFSFSQMYYDSYQGIYPGKLMSASDSESFLSGENIDYLENEWKSTFNSSNSSVPGGGPSAYKPGQSYFLNIHIGASSLYNSDIYDSDWNTNNGLGYQVEFGYSKRLKELLSFGVGVGYSSYAFELSNDVSYETVETEDPSDVYPPHDLDKRVEYIGIVEKTTIGSIDIPLFIEIGNVRLKKVGYYLRLGLKASFPISTKFEGTGKYTVRGYYPDFNNEGPNLVEDVPEIGCVSNQDFFSGESDSKLNTFNLSALVSCGLSIPLSNDWIMRLGGNFIYGFMDISASSDRNYDDVETNVNHILENENASTTTRSFGGEIGIQYVIDIY